MNMIRLVSLNLSNIKNTSLGTIVFDEKKAYDRKAFRRERPGLIGIFGENGSGKSTVIESLALLKAFVSGYGLSETNAFDFIVNREKGKGSIEAELLLSTDSGIHKIVYKIDLRILDEDSLVPVWESLRCSVLPKGKNRFYVLIPPICIPLLGIVSDSLLSDMKMLSVSELFKSKKNPAYLAKARERLKAILETCHTQKSSFLFHKDFLALLKESGHAFCKDLYTVLSNLQEYFRKKVHVLPDPFLMIDDAMDQHRDKESLPFFPFEKLPREIHKSNYRFWKQMQSPINAFLSSCVQDFRITIGSRDSHLLPDGKVGMYVDVYSTKGKRSLPLREESNGKRKLARFAYAILSVTSDPGVLLAIDEFDSDIFEPLFQKIVEVLTHETKGQFIFTASSLKALEAMNNHNVYVTTANPDNRFTQLEYVTRSNNLRDFYIKALRDESRQKERLVGKARTDKLKDVLLPPPAHILNFVF